MSVVSANRGDSQDANERALRISVIATVRNESATITAFLESLLGQSVRPDEIVIVDGASSDGTLQILQGYAQRHGVRVISRPCNIAEGRNLGIAAATGTLMAVTDAGCRVDADWLREIVRCFEGQPDVDVVAGNFRFETHSEFEEAVVLATFPPNRDDTEGARFYPSSRSVAFTKAAWQRAGGYPEWLYAAEDTLFNIRLRQIGCSFIFCKSAIVRWRPRETWRAVARQRINFARGNARVGIGTSGYLKNLRIHGLIVVMLLCGTVWPALLLLAASVLGWHVRQHLWPQATAATRGRPRRMLLLTVSVMEFVRLVSMYGFLRGRWDRFRDGAFVANQHRYMGVSSVEELEARGVV